LYAIGRRINLKIFSAFNVNPALIPPVTEAKRLVNRSSRLPDDDRFAAAYETFMRMLTWPWSRIARIVELGLQKPGDFELRLGHHLA
jgi:hypothetical protein